MRWIACVSLLCVCPAFPATAALSVEVFPETGAAGGIENGEEVRCSGPEDAP